MDSYISSLADLPGVKADVVLNKRHTNSKRDVYFFSIKGDKEDRAKARKKVEAQLKKHKIKYDSLVISTYSGQEVTMFELSKTTVIAVKPKSGGMRETTLNATITELMPAIAFLNKITTTDVTKFYCACVESAKGSTAFLTSRDEEKGLTFIEEMQDSSKFSEKIGNAIAIAKWLRGMNDKKKISNVLWTYRDKPSYLDPNSPADIVIEYKDKSYLGVSLKAGDASGKEPLLNTYVNVLYDTFSTETKKKALISKLYDEVYSTISGIQENYYDLRMRSATKDILWTYENKNMKAYNDKYDKSLDIIREHVIEIISADLNKFKSWCKGAILKLASDTIIIKASGNSVKEVKDTNKLGALLPQTKKISAYKSKTSKQNFFIDLYAERNKLLGTMEMSIRTNKSGKEHKLQQFFNLAVKYNGLD